MVYSWETEVVKADKLLKGQSGRGLEREGVRGGREEGGREGGREGEREGVREGGRGNSTRIHFVIRKPVTIAGVTKGELA